jgi:large subunit ribosomal protein L23
MALLRRKKDTAGAAVPATGSTAAPKVARKKSAGTTPPAGYDRVIRPHVTEKAMLLSERRVSTFDVFTDANKMQIAEFVRAQYGVTPLAVRIAKNAGKVKFIRGRWGKKAGVKKAYVYLKEGDKIDLA